MSTTIVRRSARIPAPTAPSGELRVPAPPTGLRSAGGPGLVRVLMPLMSSGSGLMMMAANPNPTLIMSGSLMAGMGVFMGLTMVIQSRRQGRRQSAAARHRYVAHIGTLRRELHAAADAQRAVNAWLHPDPDELWRLACHNRRRWERRRTDDDFLAVRFGRGRLPLGLAPKVEGSNQLALADPDPVCATAARSLAQRWTTLDGQPLVVPLAEIGNLVLVGPRDQVVGCARAAIAQAVTFHAPDDLQLAIAAGGDRLADWEWCKWLPHTADADLADDAGDGRLLASSFEEFERVAQEEVAARRGGRADPDGPHLLVVIDGLTGDPRLERLLAGPAGAGVSVIHLLERPQDEPGEVDGRITVAEDGTITVNAGGTNVSGRADQLTPSLAGGLGRRLAPLRLSAASAGRALTSVTDVMDLLGVGDVAKIDPAETWKKRSTSDFLNVPFGVGPNGEPIRLDLKESALGGHGPHGLMIGATGSGKSELLRTLLASLAATHPPDELAMVLVDFKGGAAFAGLADLPHVAGIITNLDQDLGLVDRMRDALVGEQRRRQELLAAAGNLANVRTYRALRERSRPDLEPLPNLLVVIDEFSELLSQKPEFIETFVAIGRLGRSLGVHLLFSSQRLEEGRLRGLESHLSYRLGLRTFSAVESRTVLGVPDAYELPPLPGAGYLKVDTTVWERFRAALVSAPYRPPVPVEERVAQAKPAPFSAVTASGEPGSGTGTTGGKKPSEEDHGPTVLDVLVERLKNAAPKVHQVWVPPLPPGIGLDLLLGEVEAVPDRGLVATNWPGNGKLRVPIGAVDKPLEQRTEVLIHDFSGAAGHLAIVGGPQSGKTTLLRTIIASLALTHTPQEVAVHALDLGGGGLRALADLPHVGTVAGRLEPDLVRRIVSDVFVLMRRREKLFADHRIDSMADFRARRSGGALNGDGSSSDVFLVIDGWAACKQAFEDLEAAVVEIAGRGLSYGIHLLMATGRWMDFRLAIKEAIGGRFELRLNDPVESYVDRKVAASLAGSVPGRGLTRDKLFLQAAMPRIDGDDDPSTLATGIDALVQASAAASPFPKVAPVRLLPDMVKVDEMPPPGADNGFAGVPIGLSEEDLGPAYLDLTGTENHLVVFGDSQSGKTSFLRGFIQALCARRSPDEAQILVVDYRRGLLEVVPSSHQKGYAASAVATLTEVDRLREILASRLPGADLTPAQLRTRSWWSGPDLYVIVDDYDLVVTPSGNPLSGLGELLPQSGDLGLHLILTRRSGGLSRGLYEPVLQRVRELGAVHLLLSGDPDEGPVAGPYRMYPQPPGRGLLVGRNGATVVQTAYAPEIELV